MSGNYSCKLNFSKYYVQKCHKHYQGKNVVTSCNIQFILPGDHVGNLDIQSAHRGHNTNTFTAAIYIYSKSLFMYRFTDILSLITPIK